MRLPPYEIFPDLKDERILLRQILPADMEDIVDISRYDGKAASTVQEASEMQDKINEDYRNGSSIHWGIMDKETSTIVGTCGYYRGLDKGIGELGCILRPVFRGQGYMTAALKLAINFGIEFMALNRITAITSSQNEQAVKLLVRLNFKKTADLGGNKVEYQFVDDRS